MIFDKKNAAENPPQDQKRKMPSWFKSKVKIVAMMVVFALLCLLKTMSVQIPQGTPAFVFCGFCLALSIIAPGMSSSALLMPLGLYTPFLYGIGHLSPAVLIPAGISAVFTIILLSKAINLSLIHI